MKEVTATKLGTAKFMLERVMSYIGIINFAMILYLYVREKPLGIDYLYWAVLIAFFIPIVAIFDWVLIYPSVLSIGFGNKNKGFREMKEDIRAIMDHFGIERKKE